MQPCRRLLRARSTVPLSTHIAAWHQNQHGSDIRHRRQKRAVMGSVFGRESVEEPPHQVLFRRTENVALPYEIRRYDTRFAACVSSESGDRSSSFRTLARYIGVFGTPENDGSESIAMTAPVMMQEGQDRDEQQEPTKIDMTAPVMMKDRTMKFVLPSKFGDMSQIPKPTNPEVFIEEIPPQFGAVHRFNGDGKNNREKAKALANQLIGDGVEGITEERVMDGFQYWGYNPPFTIPYFRRNEVWFELTEAQVDHLRNKFVETATN